MLILIMQGVYWMDVLKHVSSNLPVVRCRKDIHRDHPAAGREIKNRS